jgi:hypothetical protein
MRHPAPSVKHQLGGRQTKRWRPGFTSETAATFSFGASTIVILWTLASYWGPHVGSLPTSFPVQSRPTSPPALVTAAPHFHDVLYRPPQNSVVEDQQNVRGL